MEEDKFFNELKELVEVINRSNRHEIDELEELVDEIVKYKYEDEKTISCVFDRMLSIEFVAEEDLKGMYYKLLKYTGKIDRELSRDYEQFFIEKFADNEENL